MTGSIITTGDAALPSPDGRTATGPRRLLLSALVILDTVLPLVLARANPREVGE